MITRWFDEQTTAVILFSVSQIIVCLERTLAKASTRFLFYYRLNGVSALTVWLFFLLFSHFTVIYRCFANWRQAFCIFCGILVIPLSKHSAHSVDGCYHHHHHHQSLGLLPQEQDKHHSSAISTLADPQQVRWVHKKGALSRCLSSAH